MAKYESFAFSEPVIVRLVTKTGKVYDLAKPWAEPFDGGANHEVAFISEHAETREVGDGDDDDVDEEVSAHYYEVWSVPEAFMGSLYGLIMQHATKQQASPEYVEKFAEAVKSTPGVRVRRVYAENVDYDEREMSLRDALPAITAHFEDVFGIDVEIPETPAQPQQRPAAVAAPNGG